MEYNDYGNAPRCPVVKSAVESQGDRFTVWLTRNFTGSDVRAAAIASKATGVVLEGEIPAEFPDGSPNPQAVDWDDVLAKTDDLQIYKAVITNHSPFTHGNGTPNRELVGKLVAHGWHCLTECYDLTGDPTQWIPRQDWQAKNCGWPESQPVIGLYAGRTLDSYPTRGSYRNWSCWAAEYVL